jgi:anti-anti-sigma factor
MFYLRQKRYGYTTVLSCSGRLVFPDAVRLRTAVQQLHGTRMLVLDFADVITIDAAGMGALVALYHWAKSGRTEFKLMNVGSTVKWLLKLTKLDTVLKFCSVQEMLTLLYCPITNTGESCDVSGHKTSCPETDQAQA